MFVNKANRVATKIATILVLVLAVLLLQLYPAVTWAWASEECGTSEEPATSQPDVSVNTSSYPIDNPATCIELEANLHSETGTEGNAICEAPCPAAEGATSTDIQVEAAIYQSSGGAPIYEGGASVGVSECATVSAVIGTCREEAEPAKDPDQEPPIVRSATLDASHEEGNPQDKVTFSGAVSGLPGCSDTEAIHLRARRPGQAGFQTLRVGTTDRDGIFRFEVTIGEASEFVAVAPATSSCEEAISPVATVQSSR